MAPIFILLVVLQTFVAYNSAAYRSRVKAKCCVPGVMNLRLTGRGYYSGRVHGLSRPTFTRGRSRHACNVGALVKVNFQKLHNCHGCQNTPDCGRRMLQFDMYLSRSRGGWSFNVGDSRSVNGYGGDGGDQRYDAEIHGLNNHILRYKGDKCLRTRGYHKVYRNAMPSSVYHIRIYVGNSYMRIKTNRGLDVELCDKCLFALNGQRDTERLGRNEDVFVAINRVVGGVYRHGYGVCSARLRWACPWN